MYRVFQAEKDTYITNRVTRNERQYNANVGQAGTLDLFTLYGITRSGSSPNLELSRLLVKFDTEALRNDVAAGLIDISNSSFRCSLRLFDVYGGQPTPTNFKIIAYPLSKSFDEGQGRDIAFFQDYDVVNFYTASYANGVYDLWNAPGADSKGALGSPDIDIIASGNLGAGVLQLSTTQSFVAGTENLELDVTRIMSGVLAGQLPDCGFRISFLESYESDNKTRFVKRFGTRHSNDPYVRPQLVVRYNDSLRSNTSNLTFDATGSLFLFNHVHGALQNLVSGSSLTTIAGNNSLLLTLTTIVSSSTGNYFYSTSFTASQYRVGTNFVTGTYVAQVCLPSSNPVFRQKIIESGSVVFTQTWSSLDYTVGFLTGTVVVNPQKASTSIQSGYRYVINTTNVLDSYRSDDKARIRVFVFDPQQPYTMLVRAPVEAPSVMLDTVHFSVRDAITNDVIIPFDTTYNSTLLSSDSATLFFDLYASSLIPNRTYVIDLMHVEGNFSQVYRNVSPVFRIVES